MAGLEHYVGQICSSFSSCTESRRASDPAHRERSERKGDLGCSVFYRRECNTKVGDVCRVQMQAVESISNINFAHVDGPVLGVCIDNQLDQLGEGMAKLHCLGRFQQDSVSIDLIVTVVNYRAGAAIVLRDHSNGDDAKILKVCHCRVWDDHSLALRYHLCHFFFKECGVLNC
jgi:hypothetical protein